MDEKIEQLQKMIDESNSIVFFGGAGVSTESGIPDFRSETGIYNTIKRYKRSPEEILSHSFFKSSLCFLSSEKTALLLIVLVSVSNFFTPLKKTRQKHFTASAHF